MVTVWKQPSARFNVLLTEDRPREPEHWTRQLPLLLEPQGVAAYLAQTGQEAVDLAGRIEMHAAVIDMSTPVSDAPAEAGQTLSSAREGGLWLLELMRRLPKRPAIVVIRTPASDTRQAERVLGDALRLGAFSVLDKPVGLEQLLAVFRRVVDRRYHGFWPA